MKKQFKQLLMTMINQFRLAPMIALMSRKRCKPIFFWQRLAGLAINSYCPEGTHAVIIPLNNRQKMLLRLNLSEDLDRSIYFFGAHERETADFISFRLRSPEIKVFYDIGANLGFYTIMAGQLLQLKQGWVEAFEPVPWVYTRLIENVEINRLKNIRLHTVAVSEHSGTSTMYLPHGSDVFSTNATLDGGLAKRFNSLFASQGTAIAEMAIQTESVDALIEKGNIFPPDLIHMDVEGEELKALMGMITTIRAYSPELILEILPGRHADIQSFLNKLNYRLYHMSAGKLHSCNDYCVKHSGRDWYAKQITV